MFVCGVLSMQCMLVDSACLSDVSMCDYVAKAVLYRRLLYVCFFFLLFVYILSV